MGAAVLVTLGILFLLQEYWYLDFDRTWPVLLIVIGLCSYAAHNASTEGHVQPWWAGGKTIPPGFGPENPQQGGQDSRQAGTDSQVKL